MQADELPDVIIYISLLDVEKRATGARNDVDHTQAGLALGDRRACCVVIACCGGVGQSVKR